mmetsp:Transcript_21509/g.61833  ORF Transcript_21509/g.61833 Transcript_21509/m.61833 type:complete len:318 (-) Transcript_21509:168-1121(-)
MLRRSRRARLNLVIAICPLACALRVPDSDVIGADMFVGIAEACDVNGAWRLFTSQRFSGKWLTQAGSSAETPLMAAVRAGCAEIAALIMLHPHFDDKSVKKERERRALKKHALSFYPGGAPQLVHWALTVVDRIVVSKVSKQELEWDVGRALRDGVWFLPQPGEWMPPANLAEMHLPLPVRPMWNVSKLVDGGERRPSIVKTKYGEVAFVAVLDQLWVLLVVYLQSADGSPERRAVVRHMRSIGWRLYFCCMGKALRSYLNFVFQMSRSMVDVPLDSDIQHKHMQARGSVREQYLNMANILGGVWNKTGNFVIAKMH